MNSLPETPSVSAATRAAGTMLVPGCVSMRKVSHFPPASIISELANSAPPVSLVGPAHHDGGAVADTSFFGDELHGLPASRQLRAKEHGREGVKTEPLGAVNRRGRQVFIAQANYPSRKLPAERWGSTSSCVVPLCRLCKGNDRRHSRHAGNAPGHQTGITKKTSAGHAAFWLL